MVNYSTGLDTTFAALSDATRRGILARLATGEASVSELAAPYDMSLPAVSKHLRILESAGLVSKLFKVNNDYVSNLQSDLCSSGSYLKAEEASRHKETRVTFNREARKAEYLEKDLDKNAVVNAHEIDIPACVHDVLGGLYVLRTLSLQPGQTTQVAVSDGKKSVMARVEAQQREEVRTPAGVFKTIRYEAFLFNDVLYRRYGRLYVWLTDDERKVPVQIRVHLQFAIGTITLQLEKEDKT